MTHFAESDLGRPLAVDLPSRDPAVCDPVEASDRFAALAAVGNEVLPQLARDAVTLREDALYVELRAELAERACEELLELPGTTEALRARSPGGVDAETGHQPVEIVRVEGSDVPSHNLDRILGIGLHAKLGRTQFTRSGWCDVRTRTV